MRKSNINENGGGKGLVKYSALGAVIGMSSTLICLFIFAALMLEGLLPESLRDVLLLVSVILGSTIGGLYCAGRRGRGVVTAGLTEAAAYALLVLVGTILWGKDSDDGSLLLRVIIAAVAGGCFGGVLRLHKKRKNLSFADEYYYL